jgi:small subunit ribosomal protein S20
MPNTKPAERRARNSERKHLRNHSTKSLLKTLEKNFLGLVAAGKKEEARAALLANASALDKAAKRGTIPAARASRKKSRLTARFNSLK